MRAIDADRLLEEIKGYDLDENSTEYKAFMREIALAPTEARTVGEWLRMKIHSRETLINIRFKDMPMTREGWGNFQSFIVALILAYFVYSILGAIKLLDVWKH